MEIVVSKVKSIEKGGRETIFNLFLKLRLLLSWKLWLLLWTSPRRSKSTVSWHRNKCTLLMCRIVPPPPVLHSKRLVESISDQVILTYWKRVAAQPSTHATHWRRASGSTDPVVISSNPIVGVDFSFLVNDIQGLSGVNKCGVNSRNCMVQSLGVGAH